MTTRIATMVRRAHVTEVSTGMAELMSCNAGDLLVEEPGKPAEIFTPEDFEQSGWQIEEGPGGSQRITAADYDAAVREILEARPHVSGDALAEHLGIEAQRAKAALRRSVERLGLVKVQPGVYRLADDDGPESAVGGDEKGN